RTRTLDRERRVARLSAHGVERRSHLLLLAILCLGILRLLSRKPSHHASASPRDRAHVLLCPAADHGEHPDHGDDTYGGCRLPHEEDVLPLPRSGQARRRADPQWRAGAGERPVAVLARSSAGLRPAEERAGLFAGSYRLYRRRGDRPRDVPLLPFARHEPQAAL